MRQLKDALDRATAMVEVHVSSCSHCRSVEEDGKMCNRGRRLLDVWKGEALKRIPPLPMRPEFSP